MKRSTRGILKGWFGTAMLIAGLGIGATSAFAQVIELNVGHVLSEQSSYQIGLAKLSEILQQKAPGKFKVNVFPAGGLGGEIKLIQGIRTGVVDATIVGQPSLENTVREYRILSLPYLFDSQAQATDLLQGPLGDKLLAMLPKYNMVGLGWGGVFERNLASNKPVNKFEDMKGLKVRVIQSPGYVEAYKALGTQPTPTAYAELFLALQNGVVDACELGPDQVISDKFVDAIKYYSLIKIHHLPSIFLIAKSKLEGMPKDMQAVLVEATKEAMKHASIAHQKNIEQGLADLKAKKVTFSEPPLEPFKEAARKAWAPILADVPEGKQILADIEAAKTQIAKK